MAVVEARNIYKRYGDVQVLSDVSVSVREGEVVAVIVSPGSGKSTLCVV